MVGTQQYNLRWNNHTTNILQVFSDHLSAESLVDVSLSCQGRFVRAHKILLSACSPYFQDVFANHSDKHPVIILKGINYEDLQSLVKFMYTGEIRVQETQLDDLLAAAEMLQVKGLSNVRKKYEKGEITSVDPLPKLVPTETQSDSIAANNESSANSVKTTVAAFAPTTTQIPSPNTVAAVPTASTTIESPEHSTGPAKSRKRVSISQNTIVSSQTATNSASVLSFVGSPIVNAIIPVSRANNSIVMTGDQVVDASSVIMTTAITTPTTVADSIANSIDSIIGTCLISTEYTKTTLDNPTIDCGAGKIVEPSDGRRIDENIATKDVDTSSANKSDPTTTKEKSMVDNQPPRIRKRRKMSHTVNELAKETVFTSNGTVFLEPDDAVSKNRSKTIEKTEASTTLCKKNVDNSSEVNAITVQKMGVKKDTKITQQSLLIRNKDENLKKIPRPPNAFMIFANEWRRKLALENPYEGNKKISMRLGVLWKGLSINAKEIYYKLAKKASEEHKLRYPDYFYSPKEARLRKIQRQDLMITKCSSATTIPQSSRVPEIVATYTQDDEREIVEFTDSSEGEDETIETRKVCRDDKEQCNDDVIIDECSTNENVSVDKSHRRSKRKRSGQRCVTTK